MRACGSNFHDETPKFHPVIHFNWLAKSNWWGPRPSCSSILLVITVVPVYCCTRRCTQKLKIKNGETRLFCQIFFTDGISIKGGGLLVSFLLGYAYDLTSMLFVILRFCALFCLFACQSDTYDCILYNHAKYVILLVKVKMVLNSNCRIHTFNFFTIFNCIKTYFLLHK